MTTVVAWAAYDNRGPSAVYMASDSRISWSNASVWDSARKIFSCDKFPDLIGYVGEVLFTVQILSQCISLSNSGAVFKANSSPEQRFELLCSLVKRSFSNYPKQFAQDSFSIVFCSLTIGGDIFVGILERKGGQWAVKYPRAPKASGLILVEGSGSTSFGAIFKKFEGSEIGGTSRSVYSAFCMHLEKGMDSRTGAPPQLAVIYRNGISKPLGTVWGERSYMFGLELGEFERVDVAEWRNELFERCDARTLKIKDGAQRQPIPENFSWRNSAW